MRLVLDCPSGIAGNLWMAAMLGLGSDPRALEHLPERLGVPNARIVWERDEEAGVSQVEIRGVVPTAPTDYGGLVARVRGAGLDSDEREHALEVLAAREEAEARLLGLDLASRRFRDEDVADTLLDVVGGVLAWAALGRPSTSVRGPVVAGLHPRPSALELLDGIPVAHAGAELPLATPTGAALLRSVWTPSSGAGPVVRQALVPGDFSMQAGLAPLGATLRVAADHQSPVSGFVTPSIWEETGSHGNR